MVYLLSCHVVNCLSMIGFRRSQLSSHLSAVGRKCGSLFHSHQQNVFVALFFSWRELEEMCRTLSSCQNVGKKFSLRFFSAGTWGNSKDPFMRQQRGIIYATQAVSTASTASSSSRHNSSVVVVLSRRRRRRIPCIRLRGRRKWGQCHHRLRRRARHPTG